jgi:hypothetical protein
MSINSLLVDNSDKSWSNLYVNSLTSYNDVTVKGKLKLEGVLDTPTVLKQSYAITGAISGFNVDVGLYEFGGIVNIFIELFSHSSTSTDIITLTPTTPIPSKFKPRRELIFPILLKIDGVVGSGVVRFDSTGNILLASRISISGSLIAFDSGYSTGIIETSSFTFVNRIVDSIPF